MHYYFEVIFHHLSFLNFFSLSRLFQFSMSNDVNFVDSMAYAEDCNFLIFNWHSFLRILFWKICGYFFSHLVNTLRISFNLNNIAL